MSSRTFTVFQDAPTSETKRSRAASVSSATSPLSAKPMNASQATTLTTTEKENLHPVTGEIAGTGNTTKKRKTSVLATKVQVPFSSKKQKEQKEQKEPTSTPDTKKRKSTTTSAAKVKAGVKKDGKSATSLRKGTKRVSRKASSLPKVDEEAEAERERAKISQAEIDSRCYELTVKPLADLSQAYEQCSSLETLPTGDEKTKFRPVKVSDQSHLNVPRIFLTMILYIKASSAEPEIRNYFLSPPQSAALPPAPLISSSTSSAEARSFSAPERKQIYAVFTFISPSPTSERYCQATRASSVPRLESI